MARLNIPLFVALAVSLLSAIDARDTLPHQRMIRKRGPALFPHVEARAPAHVVPRWSGLVDRQAADPSPSPSGSPTVTKSGPTSSGSATASPTSTLPTSSPTSTSTSTSVQSTSTASTSSPGGLLNSITAVLGGSLSSTSTSSTTSSSTSLSSTSTTSSTPLPSSPASSASVAQPTTPAPAPVTPSLNLATTPAPTPNSNPTPSTIIVTSTQSATPAEQSATAKKERTAKITKNTIISLVVVASCIAGAIAIWTVIRKWKLSPSERFDDRMQPIDWAPTGGAGGARDDPVAEKMSHRRAGSAGSHGSFTSGGVGQSELGHGGAKSVYSDGMGHGNGNAQYGAQAQDFPPPHDFTAGAVNGGYGQQYAGAGYADLRRGPSMAESNYSRSTYGRGPAYETQPGAAGVPPMPNPYGGYEEDYYQPAQGHTQAQGQGQYRGY